MIQKTQEQFESLLTGIDRGIHMHLAWNQRLMRCALLHESPGDDMMQPDAHRRCLFGQWFLDAQATLTRYDPAATEALEDHHRQMHDAVRRLYSPSVGGRADPEAFQAYESGQSGMVASLHVLRQKVVESALQHDALTGLPLRHGLQYAFEFRQKDAVRYDLPLYLVLADADHFKKINDTRGHPIGDLALQHMAALMTKCLRESDILVRFGGEEFLFLLMGTGVEQVVRRVLDEVRRHPLVLEGAPALALTLTAGLTQVRPEDTLESAIDRADQALLDGKQQGRDRYVIAPLPESDPATS